MIEKIIGLLLVTNITVEEMEEIKDYLEQLEDNANKAIQLMQERRTALISSVVTGKINVSNWQHPNEAKTEFSA